VVAVIVRQQAEDLHGLDGFNCRVHRPNTDRLRVRLSGRGHKYADARGQGFLAQARRERRAYPSGVCKERATPPEPKGPAALRVAPHWACGLVARWSQVHEGQAPSSRLATGPMRQQRTSSYLWP
jgi:hypothetical protein